MEYPYRVIRFRKDAFQYFEVAHISNGQPIHEIWTPTLLEAWEIGQLMGGN